MPQKTAAAATTTSAPESITITSTVPLSRIAGLLVSALEGGSGYWLRVEKYQVPPTPVAHMEDLDEVYPHVDYPLTEGGAVICRDIEDPKRGKLTLDLDAIKRGLALMQARSPRHWGDFVSENYDATTGDVFVQYCLLGELVYG